MSVVDDIKSRIDLVELISETVKLRKSGRTYTGLCPFHAHKNNTPSFAVWPESGNWRCFGQCNEGGDAFKFIMKRDGLDFAEALRVLAQRAGVELVQRTPVEQERDDNLAQLRQLLEEAVIYYHHLLKNAPGPGPQAAREHLARRGLSDKAVEMFQLGYAPEAWDAALKYFTGKNYAQSDLLDAGLIVVKEEDGRVFDRFRDRLMIPVRDERGRMTGFQARALKPDAVPKFMNSPQTALFDKGRTLFGLDRARKAVREAEAAIVVEGNLDVVAAHQAGFENVVSSQGTALTEHQMRLLKKYARRIILALDADAAGDAATLRGLSVAREALDREADVVFDPRGLVRTEGRLGADIRVMTLPAGQDPDEVIRRDPAEWRSLVEAAEPVVAYVIRVLTAGRDLNDPKVKTDIAATVLPLIEDVAQPIERDTYRQKLSRVLHVDVRALRVQASGRRESLRRRLEPGATESKGQADAAAQAAPAGRAEPDSSRSRLEAYCLGCLLRQPELLYRADRELQALGLAKLAADDFLDVEHQLIFSALSAALEQVDYEPADHLAARLDPALQPRLASLQAEAAASDPSQARGGEARGNDVRSDEVRSDEALIAAVMRLRRRTVSNWLHELRFLAEDAREQGDQRAEAYQAEISRQALALAGVDRALARNRKRGAGRPQRIGLR
jgi:DNA primase